MLHVTFWRNLRHSRNGELSSFNGPAEMFAALYTRHPRPIAETPKEQEALAAQTTLPRLLWTPARIAGNSRQKATEDYEASALVLTYERGTTMPEQALRAWRGFTVLWQASLAYTDPEPRFHLVVPFSEPVAGADMPEVFRLATERAVPGFTTTPMTSQSMYFAHWRGSPRGVQYGELYPPFSEPPALEMPGKPQGTLTPAERLRQPGSDSVRRGVSGRRSDATDATSLSAPAAEPRLKEDATLPVMARMLGLSVKDGQLGPCPECGAEHRSSSQKPPQLACTATDDLWHCRACNTSGRALDLVGLVLFGQRLAKLDNAARHDLSRWLEGRSFLATTSEDAPSATSGSHASAVRAPTPGRATPRPATPRATGPRTATPRPATPRATGRRTATPRPATPRATGPRSATPRPATPRASSPRSATPPPEQPRSEAPPGEVATLLGPPSGLVREVSSGSYAHLDEDTFHTAGTQPKSASYGVDWVSERLKTVREHGFAYEPPEADYFLGRHGEGVMQRGRVGLLAGGGGLGKGYSLLDLALLCAGHSPEAWLGAFEIRAPGPALVLLGDETPVSMHRRLRKLCVERDLGVHWEDDLELLPGAGKALSLVTATGDRTPLFYDLLRALRRRERWGVVILDPLLRLASWDGPHEAQQAASMMLAIQELAEAAPGAPPFLVGCHTADVFLNGMSPEASDRRMLMSVRSSARWIAVMREDVSRIHPDFGHPVYMDVVKASEDRRGDTLTLFRTGERGGLLQRADRRTLEELRYTEDGNHPPHRFVSQGS